MPDPNTITILQCEPGHRTSKIHVRRRRNGAIKTTPFNAGMWFKPYELQVHSIHELHALLTEMEVRSDLLIIRGQLNPDMQREREEPVRRLKHPRPEEDLPIAPFIEAPRQWVMLDFDGIPNPGGLDPTSREAMEFLRTLLPTEFQISTCSYSLSSSAGMSASNTIRGHLWFYVDRPVGEKELKAWLAAAPIDRQLLGTCNRTTSPHQFSKATFRIPSVRGRVCSKGGVTRSRSRTSTSRVLPCPPLQVVPAA